MDCLEQVFKYNRYTNIRYIKFTLLGRIAGIESGPESKIVEHLLLPPHESLELKFADLVNLHTLHLHMEAEAKSKTLIHKGWTNLADYQPPHSAVLSFFSSSGPEHHNFKSVVPGAFQIHSHPSNLMLSYSVIYNIHDMFYVKNDERVDLDSIDLLELD